MFYHTVVLHCFNTVVLERGLDLLVAVIVACEIGFWVFLLGGLSARYLLRRRRLGAVLLVMAPLVDLVLLAASVLDLRTGGTATVAHALAAIYLGCSVAFGHRLIHAMDVRFAHRYAAGPPPPPKPRHGRAHAAAERRGWYRHLLAWAVGCALMMLAVRFVGDPARTQVFLSTSLGWTLAVAVDAVVSFGSTHCPRRTTEPADTSTAVDLRG